MVLLQLFCLTDPLLLGDFGGNGRAVQGQLKGVQHIQASYSAFAAVLTNGLVLTWGHAYMVATAVVCKIS